MVFGIISVWHFVPYDSRSNNERIQYIFEDAIVYTLYIVLFIEFGKLIKFVVVFVVGLVNSKRKANKNKNKNINTTTSRSLKSNKSIKSIKS